MECSSPEEENGMKMSYVRWSAGASHRQSRFAAYDHEETREAPP